MPSTITRTRRRWRRETALPYLLLTPALILLVGMVYPFGLGLYYSLTNYWLQYPNRFRFIWFDNYVNLIAEPLFVRALEFTLGFTLAAVILQVGLGLMVALFLHARIPGRKVLRALMLLPLMMPPVITALMWKIMMASTNAGILNYLLSFVGVDPINWFGSTNGAIASILIIDTWGNLPFVALILLGGLQALPTEPYEAARVDGASPIATFRYITLPLLSPFILLTVTFRTMDSLRIFDVIYATTMGGPNDATTNLQIMALQYSFQWYQMGKGIAMAILLLVLVVIASAVLMRLWNQAAENNAMTSRGLLERLNVRNSAILLAAAALLLWTVFPFFWILLTSLKSPGDIISVPPKFVFAPTTDNYAALVIGEQRGQDASTRPDFPRFFLNSIVISVGAVALSVAAGIPAAYALARFTFPLKNALAFVFMSFRFVPFLAFVIPLYLLYQRVGFYNTHAGLIFAYQLITLPFTVWMLRSFFQEIPLEIQEAAKIDGCSWLGVLTRVILPLSMPGISVTVILGFIFCWNAFNYPLMLAGRQTFPVTVGAIQFISYEQVLWGQMAAATIVATVPQLVLSLMVQKYIVRGLTMGAVR